MRQNGKWRKLLSMALALVLLLTLLPVEARAAADGDWTYTVSGNAATITAYNGSGGSVTIPSTLGGKPVTTIGRAAFYQCTGLTTVTIPNSVASIGIKAFSGCTGLTAVTIPNSVTGIGAQAFSACTSLTAVTIPNSVTSIDFEAFSGCTGLTAVTIPKSVTSLNSRAFSGCSGLTKISVAADNPTYCSVDGVLFNKAITTLFAYPVGKTGSYTIPSSITSIGEYAFSGCTGLTAVTIPSSVTSIGDFALTGCTGLTTINIAADNSAYCSMDGVVFSKDKKTLVVYPSGRSGSYSLPSSVTSIGNAAFSHCTGLTTVTIPSGVTMIGEYAFSGCTGLTAVTIPKNVTSISVVAFNRCTGLTNINVAADNSAYCSVDGVVFSKDKKTLVAYPAGRTGSYTIPNGVISIGKFAFEGCIGLTTVIIPSGVTSIDSYAFGYTGLISVTIPSGVTTIGDCTFDSCTGLTSVTLPDSITLIGANAFNDCTGLTDVYYAGTQAEWNKITFRTGNTFLYIATIHYGSTPATYTVAYDANGGTGTPSTQTKTENVSLTLSSIKPTKSYTLQYNAAGGSVTPATKTVSCTFRNWNTAQNGSGTAYAPGASYTANADATLYAQWTNPAAGELATPTRSGYTFAGWFTAASGGTQITASSTLSSNTTVYAHWTESDSDPYNLGDETYSFDNYSDTDAPGHCFGMSMTSAGYHLGLLDIAKIGGNANTPLYSFGRTATVKAPICYYQNKQGNNAKQATVAGGSFYLNGWSDISSDWQAVVNYVSNHAYDGTGLLQIGYRKGIYGHAINFLRYEKVNGQDRIYAYDNNFPNQETYFYQDSSGNVWQAPVQTFTGSIDCIALRDCRIYFSVVSSFDASHVIYMPIDSATVQGYTYSYMEGTVSGEQYVMYEIPAEQKWVYIIPNRDNADFIYMDTEYSFGKIEDHMRGKLVFATMNEGAVVSEANFQIFIAETPEIKQQPANVTAAAGGTATFRVTATGAESYQWQASTDGGKTWKNSGASGSKTATTSFTAAAAHNGYLFRCIVTGAGESVTSSAAKLTVSSSSGGLTITTQPSGVSVTAGSTATFRVAAAGAASYQWQASTDGGKTWKNSGANGNKTATLSFTAAASHNNYQFRCVVKNSSGQSAISSAAKLTVSSSSGGLTITTQPSGVTVTAGATATFRVAATGAASYQWQASTDGGKTWKNSGANGNKTATLSFTAAAAHNNYQFRCVVKNSSGQSMVTNSATLTVK